MMKKYRKQLWACMLSVSLFMGNVESPGIVSAETEQASDAGKEDLKTREEQPVMMQLPQDDLRIPAERPLSVTEEKNASKNPVFYSGSADISSLDPVIAGGISAYGKSKLSSAQQTFYDQLEKACVAFLLSDTDLTSSKTYFEGASYKNAGLSFEQAKQAYIAFYYDHPSFFWMDGYRYSETDFFIEVEETYYLTDRSRDRVEDMIKTGVAAYKAEADAYSDAWEKVRAIHDKMILEVEYAYKRGTKTPENATWAHNVEGVFNPAHSQVVCEGYAKAFSLITNYLNIKSFLIVGTAGGAHAWNAVSFDQGKNYSYMDLTWDDETGDKIGYDWFAAPASKFTKEHRAYTSSGSGWEWLYALPSMTTDMTYTYFTKYGTSATTAAVGSSDTSALTFLKTAAGKVPFYRAIILADSVDLLKQLNRAYNDGAGGSFSYSSSRVYDGKVYQYFDLSKYQVANPASSFSLSENAISVGKDDTAPKTITIQVSGSDDWILLSVDNPGVVTLDGTVRKLSKRKTFTLVIRNAGTAKITAKSLVGGHEEICTVTVTSDVMPEHFYLDEKHTMLADTSMTAYANGGSKSTGSATVNYKTAILYTNLVPPTYKNKGKNATGKIAVGVTLSSQEPGVKNNAVLQTAAAKQVATAAYKKTSAAGGKITVTAKAEGMVYVWIYALTSKDVVQTVDVIPVTILPAPTKVIFQDTACVSGTVTNTFQAVTAKTVSLNTSFSIYLNPTIAVSGKYRKTVTYSDFSYVVPDSAKPYLSVEKLSGSLYGFRVTPIALKGSKATKVSFQVICDRNGTSAKLTVNITNSIKSMQFGKLDQTDESFTVGGGGANSLKVAIAKGAGVVSRSAKLKETVTLYQPAEKSLDGTKVYQLPSADGFSITNAGKVTVNKGITAERKKVSMARIKGTTDQYNITAKAGVSDGLTAYLLVVHNGLAGQGCGWQVIEVTVGDGTIRGNEKAIWADARDVELKKTKLNTDLDPGTYVSGKKTLAGKIVWVSRETKGQPTINTSTRTVNLKSDSKAASVSAEGVVTAKAGGTAYVYACATATGECEEFIVQVKATPANIRLYQTESDDPVAGAKEYKSDTVAQGGKVEIYVKGTTGKITKSENTMKVLSGEGYDYTFSVAEKQQAYVEITQSGEHFTVKTANDAWTKSGTAANKKLKIPVHFLCVKNGKKGTFTLYVAK